MRIQRALLGVLTVGLLCVGAEARGGRRGKPGREPYKVIDVPETPNAWGAIQGVCRLSHPVTPVPVEIGCGRNNVKRMSRTALFDAQTLGLSDCLVRLVKIGKGKPWSASMRVPKKERVQSIRIERNEYVPRLSWVRRNAQLSFHAPDAVCEFNVHGYYESLNNTRFNFFVAKGSPPVESSSAVLEEPGLYLLRDDCHAGMAGMVFSSHHPYVSGPTANDGRYALSQVPPGTYQLELIHEGIGLRELRHAGRIRAYDRDAPIRMTRTVTVKPGEVTTIDWTIDSEAYSDLPDAIQRKPYAKLLDEALHTDPKRAAKGRASLVTAMGEISTERELSRGFSLIESHLLRGIRGELKVEQALRLVCVTESAVMVLDGQGICVEWFGIDRATSNTMAKINKLGVVAMADVADGTASVHLVPADRSDATTITLEGNRVTDMSWSPKGTHLAVTTADVDDTPRLFVVTTPADAAPASIQVPGSFRHCEWDAAGTRFATTREGELVFFDLVDGKVHGTSLKADKPGRPAWGKSVIAWPTAKGIQRIEAPYRKATFFVSDLAGTIECAWTSDAGILYATATSEPGAGHIAAYDASGFALGDRPLRAAPAGVFAGNSRLSGFLLTDGKPHRVLVRSGVRGLHIEPITQYPVTVLSMSTCVVDLQK